MDKSTELSGTIIGHKNSFCELSLVFRTHYSDITVLRFSMEICIEVDLFGEVWRLGIGSAKLVLSCCMEEAAAMFTLQLYGLPWYSITEFRKALEITEGSNGGRKNFTVPTLIIT
eukprot:4381793-Amphidinium_carterae.1